MTLCVSLASMKKSYCSDVEFLQSVHKAVTESSSDNFHLWWLGQSGFLIVWRGHKLLLDPYLSDSLSVKYSDTDKPHVRMVERLIDPARLPAMDIVTSSHNHTDHLDAETLNPVLKNSPGAAFIIPAANRDFVSKRLTCSLNFPTGLNDGEEIQIKQFTIHAVPAAHNEIERDDSGRSLYLGYVIKFGSWSVYHSGDTMLYNGIGQILKPFGVDCALLPINGYDPARRVAGNLDGREAAELGKQIGAGIVIPHHYDMFEFNTADPKWFEECCIEVNQPYRTLKIGEHLLFTK